MAEYDVTDEVIINASPDVVYQALMAEYSGKADWMPNFEVKQRGEGAVDQPGALLDLTLHGRFDLKFTAKTVKTKKNESWEFEYVEGAFRGEGLWKLEAAGEDTKVSFRWHCRPGTLLVKIMSPFVNVPKSHSEFMKAGFASLNEYVRKNAES
jgi:ribosome-associated toxin RatA of RatAB toxin-antitoxin module